MNGRRESGTGIDWVELRARLAKASEDTRQSSPERAAAILDERTRALARASEDTGSQAETFDALAFELAGEAYAVETSVVRTVLASTEIVRVPLAPKVLAGLATVRGDVLPVFDLAVFFGLTADGRSPESLRVVVFGDERSEFAALVDRLVEVRRLAPAELLEPPDSERLGGLVRGVAAIEGTALVVLDGRALLADERLFIDARGPDSGFRGPDPGSRG
jgi:purine-binding chemotaxis protein CheW